jgi:hypothetical protein
MFQTLTQACLPLRSPGDSPAAAPEKDTDTQTTAEPAQTEDSAASEALKGTLLKAVEDRTRRAQSSVVRSMAEQNGVPEETLQELLSQARAEKATELPPELQQRLDEAAAAAALKLKMAEVKAVGAEMGLVDTEVALQLIDPETLSVADNGDVTGVREALESLKQRKGYLFAPPARAAWAQRVSAGSAPPVSGVEEAFYRKNPALRK